MTLSSKGGWRKWTASEEDAARTATDSRIVTEAESLQHLATIQPDHIAIIFQQRSTTYWELHCRASQVAAGIAALGVPIQTRVAMLAKNSDEYFEVFFGLVRANRIALPLNWRLTVPEIAYTLLDAEVDTLFIDDSFRPLLPALQNAVAGLRNIIVLGDSTEVCTYRAWRDQWDVNYEQPSVSPFDIMVQFYTSGTTGRPKGVQITHYSSRQMRLVEMPSNGEWTRWGPSDVAIVALPNCHLSGTSWALQWFARGTTCIVLQQGDPGLMLHAIQQYHVTHMFAVPTVLTFMLEHPLRLSTDFSSVKAIFYGGSPISPQLLENLLTAFACDLIQLYGMTETNGVVCCLSPSDHRIGREDLLRSCGRPYPMIDLRILDESGVELAPRQIGEICIRTPAIMKGYWRMETAAPDLMHGEHYRSGDAGYKDEDGYVFLVDRLKDMIVSGGENIYPAEIELVLSNHIAISEVTVIGVPDPRWGESVLAVVVRRDHNLCEQDVIAFARESLAGYKVPKSVRFVDALPRNPSGKVLKRELRHDMSRPIFGPPDV